MKTAVTIFCTKKENQISGLPFITLTLTIAGIKQEVSGQIRTMCLWEYAKGGVAREMPQDAPEEAVKVQTVCYVSYALYCIEHPRRPGICDLYDLSSHDQTFALSTKNTRTDKIVESVKGMLILFNGKSVKVAYSSSNGGWCRPYHHSPWLNDKFDPFTARVEYGHPLPVTETYVKKHANAKGIGHGYGMSQRGAIQAAKEGKDFLWIIHFYFKGIEVVKINTTKYDIPYVPQVRDSGRNKNIANIPYGIPKDDYDFVKPNMTIAEKAVAIKKGKDQKIIAYKGCVLPSTYMLMCGLGIYTDGEHYTHVKELADFSLSGGFKHNSGTDITGFVPAIMRAKSKQWQSLITSDLKVITALVKQGALAVLSVQNNSKYPNLFTKGKGHIIAMVGMEGNKIKIYNPNGIGLKAHKAGKDLYTYDQVTKSLKTAVVIKRLKEGVTPVFIPLRLKDRSARVKQMENALIRAGFPIQKDYIDNYFGTATLVPLQDFQFANNLPEQDFVSEECWKALMGITKPHGTSTPITPVVLSEAREFLTYGDKGEDILQLQEILNAFSVSLACSETSIFSAETKEAVKFFQTLTSLHVDGIVGPQTRTKMAQYK